MRSAALVRSAAAVTAPSTARVRRCGALARAALVACGGITRAVPGFETTPFRMAGDQLVWISQTGPDHPRTVLIDGGTAGDVLEVGEDTEIAHSDAVETLGGCGFSIDDARTTACRAILGLIDISIPRGFAGLLIGQSPPFPLSHRVDAVHALAQAGAADDAAAFVQHAQRLLGVGSGLTPSGDDFVGGALFALRWIGAKTAASGALHQPCDGERHASHWQQAASQLVTHAASRTHVISATLLADLARGRSYVALHDFAAGIRLGDAAAAFTHANTLVSIGASSGWDMLAGFMAALRGTAVALMPAPLFDTPHSRTQHLHPYL